MQNINPTTMDFAQVAIVFLVGPLLFFAVVTDLMGQRVSTPLVIGVLTMGIVLQTVLLGPEGLLFGFGGAAVGFAMLLPFSYLVGAGTAYAKLLAAAGGVLGPWGTLLAGTIALGTGAVLGLIWLSWLMIRAAMIATRSGAAGPAAAASSHPSTPRTGPPVLNSLAVTAGVYLAAVALYGPDSGMGGLLTW